VSSRPSRTWKIPGNFASYGLFAAGLLGAPAALVARPPRVVPAPAAAAPAPPDRQPHRDCLVPQWICAAPATRATMYRLGRTCPASGTCWRAFDATRLAPPVPRSRAGRFWTPLSSSVKARKPSTGPGRALRLHRGSAGPTWRCPACRRAIGNTRKLFSHGLFAAGPFAWDFEKAFRRGMTISPLSLRI
jgi:hypothetical protein